MKYLNYFLLIGINISMILILDSIPHEYAQFYFISILIKMIFVSASSLFLTINLSKGLRYRILFIISNALVTLFLLFYFVFMYFFFTGTLGSH